MKKIAFLFGVALSLGLMSCDDMLPNPPAQSYPEVPVFKAADLVAEQAGGKDAINLSDYIAKGEMVPVAKIVKLDSFPATYSLSMPMEIGSDADFTKVATVNTTVKENVVYATAGAINDAIREVVTKNPAELTVNARFAAFAVNGNATMQLGGVDYYYLTAAYKVKPVQSMTIEDDYYLVGNFCNWDVTKGIKFNRTVAEGSVYDNPGFQVKFEVPAEYNAANPYEYKIVPGSAVKAGNWTGAFGVQPDSVGATSGKLVAAPEAQTQAGQIKVEGPYLLKFNAEQLTYSVSSAIEFLYVPGVGSSSTDFSKVQRLYTYDYITYQGCAALNKQWWLTGQASAKGVNFKTAEGTEQVTDGLVTTGEIQAYGDGEGTKMLIKTKGLYWMNVNLVSMKYKATLLETVSVVGNHNGWNAGEAFKLTPDTKCLVWTGTVDLDGDFKINTNGNWDIDFGSSAFTVGEPSTLSYKGANMSVPAGTYTVKVDFSVYPNTITVTKK